MSCWYMATILLNPGKVTTMEAQTEQVAQTEQGELTPENLSELGFTLTELERKMVEDGRLTLEQLVEANDLVKSTPAKKRKRGNSIYSTILSAMAEGTPDKPVSVHEIKRLLNLVHGGYFQRGKQKGQRRTFDNYFTPSALDQGKEKKDRLWVKDFTVMGDETRGFWLKEVYEARNRIEHSQTGQ